MNTFVICLLIAFCLHESVESKRASGPVHGNSGHVVRLYSNSCKTEDREWVDTSSAATDSSNASGVVEVDLYRSMLKCNSRGSIIVKGNTKVQHPDSSNASRRVEVELTHAILECNRRMPIVIKGITNDRNITPAVVSKRVERIEECKVDGKLMIISRSEWGADDVDSPSEVLPTTDCVIVDGSSYVIEDTDYKAKMKIIQKYQIRRFGRSLNNFHIGDDGVVYESLGWEMFNHLLSGGLKCLRIAFMKPDRDAVPSSAAKKSFFDLLMSAICLNKLSPYYRIIPSHFIFDLQRLNHTSFERSDLLKWNRCDQNTDLVDNKSDYGTFNVVLRDSWEGKDSFRSVYNQTEKIKFVLVGDLGNRCFITKYCMEQLKWLEGFINDKGEDLGFNFFIGEDGLAYEGYNWKQTWLKRYLEKGIIEIRFFGLFHSYLPSTIALKAFDRLLRVGLEWGLLSPDYKILSYRQLTDNLDFIGKQLDKSVRKMERFSSEF